MTPPRSSVLECARTRHRRLATVLTIGVTLVLAAVPPSPDVQLVLLVALVGLLGVPHGALDHLAGAHLFRPRLGRAWLPVFLLSYLLLSGAVILFWMRFPLSGLLGFLLIAAIHFGAEDTGPLPARESARAREGVTGPLFRTMEVAGRGALPIVVPCAAHPVEVGRVFDLLGLSSAGTSGEALAVVLGSGWPLLLALLAPASVSAVRSGLESRSWDALREFLEVPVLVVALTILPALVGFVVYFVGWHAIRHTLVWVVRLEPSNLGAGFVHFARLAIPLTSATILLGMLAWYFLPGSFDARAVQVVFVGLAALTVPHVLLEVAVESFS